MSRASSRSPGRLLLVACLLAACGSFVGAAPCLFVPEWTFPLDGEPTLVRTLERGSAMAADIVVVEARHRLRVLAAGSPQTFWEFRSPMPIQDIASPQGSRVTLVVATARNLTAFDQSHRQLWTYHLSSGGGDRFLRLACGDWDQNRVQEIAAVTDRDILIVSAQGRLLARLPHDCAGCPDLSFRDIEGTGGDELVVSDGMQLTVLRHPGEQVFRLRLGLPAQGQTGSGNPRPVEPPTACLLGKHRGHREDTEDTKSSLCSRSGLCVSKSRFAIGLPGGTRPAIAVLARGPEGPGLLCLDAATGLSRWWSYPVPADSATAAGMVRIAGQNTFAAFLLPDGEWLLARIDSLGRIDRRLRLNSGCGYHDLLALDVCGRNLLLTFRTPAGLDAVTLFSPDLRLVDIQGLGYQGVRVRELVVTRVNGDDDADLLVARVSPSGRSALDFFRNNVAEVEAELIAVDNEFMTASAQGERARALRAARRSMLIGRRLGREDRISAEMITRLEHNARSRDRSRIAVLLVLLGSVGGAAIALGIITRRRPAVRPDSGLDRPGPELQAICNELITLDHIFVAKGHVDGALRRLRTFRTRFGLDREPDLAALDSRLEPGYSRFIGKLLQHPGAFRFADWLPDQLTGLGERYGGIATATMPREQFERRVRTGGFQGHWLIRIQNWDCPDIYDTLRLFLDRRAPAFFEHWLSDNLRHAASWSATVLDYGINTMWNRKLTVSFWNDGPGRVRLDRPHSNLTQQLLELARDYAEFLEISRQPSELAQHEKFWLRFWDFHSILQDIYRRQTGQPAVFETRVGV